MAVLSENLAQLRGEQNLTQEQAANGCGIVLRSYRRYELGEREPTASVIIKMADFFGVTADYLLGRTDQR